MVSISNNERIASGGKVNDQFVSLFRALQPNSAADQMGKVGVFSPTERRISAARKEETQSQKSETQFALSTQLIPPK